MENISLQDQQHALEPWQKKGQDILAGRSLSTQHQKQLLKTLRFLRDDLQTRHPEMSLPSTWLLKNIIRSSQSTTYRPHKWQSDLYKLFNDLEVMIALEKNEAPQFYRESTTERLFSSENDFSLDDLAQFIHTAKLYLQAIYNV